MRPDFERCHRSVQDVLDCVERSLLSMERSLSGRTDEASMETLGRCRSLLSDLLVYSVMAE